MTCPKEDIDGLGEAPRGDGQAVVRESVGGAQPLEELTDRGGGVEIVIHQCCNTFVKFERLFFPGMGRGHFKPLASQNR
jgi:hypothetical protein